MSMIRRSDASLAAGRRAKVYDVNKPKGAKAGEQANGHAAPVVGEGEVGEDGMTELQRAEQQLQDEEDEMEEDYVDESEEDYSGSEEEDEDGEGQLEEGGEDEEVEDEE